MVWSEVLTEEVVVSVVDTAVVVEVATVAAAETVVAAVPAAMVVTIGPVVTMLPTPGGLARPGIQTCLLGGPVRSTSFGASLLTGVRNPTHVNGRISRLQRIRIETGTSPLLMTKKKCIVYYIKIPK